MKTNSTSRPSDIKRTNQASILRFVYDNGVTSKSTICRVLGMSKPTASSLMDELVEEGILRLHGLGSSSSLGGKRPLLYEFNPKFGSVIAVHIGIDEISGTLYDCRLGSYGTTRKTTPGDPAQAIEVLLRIIRYLQSTAVKQHLPVLGVGVSVPGIVDSETGVLVRAAHLPKWRDVGIRHILEGEFKCPVFVDNESRNMAMAEKWFGAGRDVQNFVALQTFNGVGTGIVIHGEVYKGSDFNAGEFGHTSIKFDGPQCGCGRLGCWELYASEMNLVNMLGDKIPDLRGLTEESSIATVLESVGLAYRDNSTEFHKALDTYSDYLSVGISNVIKSLDPEVIILHGNLHFLGLGFLTQLYGKVALSIKGASRGFSIQYSEINGDTAQVGAAASVIQEVVSGNLISTLN